MSLLWTNPLTPDDMTALRRVVSPHPIAGTQEISPQSAQTSKSPPLKPAAVLFPIVNRAPAPTVLFTVRTAHLRHHGGQISFPGGGVESTDTSPLDTALRETEEEIGLSRDYVSILGYLPEYCTRTGFRITPILGLIQPGFGLQLDPEEVDDVFEVPLHFLMTSAHHKRESMLYLGRQRSFYAIPYQDHYIWGATAGMIISLYEALHPKTP